jgi:transforming growth factor-beta-induced protein
MRTTRLLQAMGTAALSLTLVTAEARAQSYHGAQPNVVEVAAAAGTFTTLVAAVQAAGLEETLRGSGPFTVFAPTDEAFAKLPEGTVEALLADPERLRAVLTYHVVSGRVTAEQVVRLEQANTIQGSALRIRAYNGRVNVGNATVTQADIQASNGVIHVIDTVLLPPSE